MSKLSGKVAIVTGAAQGIGASYAKALANEGAKIVLTDILDCEPIAKKIKSSYQGSETLTLITDVSDEKSTQLMVEKTIDKFGKNTSISVRGRHDPCVGIRAVPIGEAMTHCVLLDHYLMNKAQCGK